MVAVFEWLQTNIVAVISDAIIEYGGTSILFLVLIVSSITLLVLFKEQMEHGYKVYFAYAVLILLFVLFNPVILVHFEGVKEAFALFPMCSIVAYVVADKSKNTSNKLKSNAIILILALLVIWAGNHNSGDIYMRAINVYKTDDQGIILAQGISEHSEDTPVTACYILRDDEHQGDDISVCEAASQFSGKILAEYVPIYEMPDRVDADYLIAHNDIVDVIDIDSSSYSVVLNTGVYTLLGKTC